MLLQLNNLPQIVLVLTLLATIIIIAPKTIGLLYSNVGEASFLPERPTKNINLKYTNLQANSAF